MVLLVGLFLENEDKNKLKEKELVPLERRVNDLHITLDFKPKDFDRYKSIIGKVFDVKVVGYGKNETNSGFLAELPAELTIFNNNVDADGHQKPVHITTSVSSKGKAVNTYKLNFEKIEPFFIKVKAGYKLESNNDVVEYII